MTVVRNILITTLITFLMFFVLGWSVTGEFHHGLNWGKNGLMWFGLIGGMFVGIPFLGKKLGESVKGN